MLAFVSNLAVLVPFLVHWPVFRASSFSPTVLGILHNLEKALLLSILPLELVAIDVVSPLLLNTLRFFSFVNFFFCSPCQHVRSAYRTATANHLRLIICRTSVSALLYHLGATLMLDI